MKKNVLMNDDSNVRPATSLTPRSSLELSYGVEISALALNFYPSLCLNVFEMNVHVLAVAQQQSLLAIK